jgi:hypothetical protein
MYSFLVYLWSNNFHFWIKTSASMRDFNLLFNFFWNFFWAGIGGHSRHASGFHNSNCLPKDWVCFFASAAHFMLHPQSSFWLDFSIRDWCLQGSGVCNYQIFIFHLYLLFISVLSFRFTDILIFLRAYWNIHVQRFVTSVVYQLVFGICF